MHERAPLTYQADTGNRKQAFLDIPVNNNFIEYLDDSGRLENAISELEAANIYVWDHLTNSWKDKPLLDAFERQGVDIAEVVAYSSKFHLMSQELFSEEVELPEGHGSHQNGHPRRAESGKKLELERVKQAGIDPSKVIFFRVTQPSDQPKPEFYWTTDFVETRGGLSVELGKQRQTSVILIDTLESIANNGGLMRDINDDAGIAVRQLGLDSYDQTTAIGRISGI